MYSVKLVLRLEDKDLPARLMSRWLSIRLRSSTCLRHMFFHFLKENLREKGQTKSIPIAIHLLLQHGLRILLANFKLPKLNLDDTICPAAQGIS